MLIPNLYLVTIFFTNYEKNWIATMYLSLSCHCCCFFCIALFSIHGKWKILHKTVRYAKVFHLITIKKYKSRNKFNSSLIHEHKALKQGITIQFSIKANILGFKALFIKLKKQSNQRTIEGLSTDKLTLIDHIM